MRRGGRRSAISGEDFGHGEDGGKEGRACPYLVIYVFCCVCGQQLESERRTKKQKKRFEEKKEDD